MQASSRLQESTASTSSRLRDAKRPYFCLPGFREEPFRGVSIFFAVLSVLLTASWFSALFTYGEDLFVFANANLMPLSPVAEKELLKHVNTHCHESLVFLLSQHFGLLRSGSSSACLKDMTYTYLAIGSQAREPRSLVNTAGSSSHRHV